MVMTRRRERIHIALVALGTRVMCAGLIMASLALSNRYLLFPDERGYTQDARAALAGLPNEFNYSTSLAWIFEITGPNTWLPRLLNVLAGVVLAVVVYDLVTFLKDRRAGKVAGYAIAVWPSLVLWSSLVLKDIALVLAFMAFLWFGVRTLRGDWWTVVPAAAAALVVEWLRPWTFVMITIALVMVAGVATWRARRTLRLAVPVLCLVLVVGLLGAWRGHGLFGERFIDVALRLGVIHAHRAEAAGGETSFAEAPEAESDVIQGIPRGIFFNVAGPFPWQLSEPLGRALLVVEIVVWYPALVLACVGLARLRRRELVERWGLVLLLIGGSIIVLSIYGGNAGTALRLRAVIVPLVIALAAGPVADLIQRRGAPDPAR